MNEFFKALIVFFGALFIATTLHFWMVWMVVSINCTPDPYPMVIFDLITLGLGLLIIGSAVFDKQVL